MRRERGRKGKKTRKEEEKGKEGKGKGGCGKESKIKTYGGRPWNRTFIL